MARTCSSWKADKSVGQLRQRNADKPEPVQATGHGRFFFALFGISFFFSLLFLYKISLFSVPKQAAAAVKKKKNNY